MNTNWVFVVSVLTPLGVRSSRSTNPVMAFAKANHFPSAIMCWDIEGAESMVFSASFNNREELNQFFDFIRGGYCTSSEYAKSVSIASTCQVNKCYGSVAE